LIKRNKEDREEARRKEKSRDAKRTQEKREERKYPKVWVETKKTREKLHQKGRFAYPVVFSSQASYVCNTDMK